MRMYPRSTCCCFPCPLCDRTCRGGGGGGGVQDRRTHQQNHSSHRAFGKSPQRCWQKGVWTQHSARLYPSYDESFKNMAARGFVLLSFCFSGHLGESLLPVDPGG